MRPVLTLLAIAALQFMQIGALPAYAAPPDLEAEVAAKVTHLWIEFAQAHPDEQILSSEQEWENALRPTLEKIVEAELTGEVVPQVELKAATKSVLDLIRWKDIFIKIKNLPTLIKTTARIKGIGMVAALSVSLSVDISVPIILTALGHPGLALLSPSIPYNFIGLSIASITQRYRLRKEMIELLGGDGPYQEFINQQKILRKALRLRSPKDLLFPIQGLDGKFEAAVISESSLFATALEKIGFSEKQLTFSNLKKFCLKNAVALQYAQDLA